MKQTTTRSQRDPSRNRSESWLIAIASGVLAFACYGAGLSYGLTDLDTMMNIASARLDTLSDLETVLLGKLTGGRAGLDANFYRPSLMALFAVVRGLFGWEPAAYHAVNISLHAVCTVLVVAFARAAARRFGLLSPRSISLWVGFVFALHPVAVEVVPAIARAGDLLVTAFFLVAMLAADRYLDTCQLESRTLTPAGIKRAALFCVFSALALSSKESGVALFAIAPLYLVLARRDAPAMRRVSEVAVLMVPAAAVALVFFGVRAQVLGEPFGGYHLENSIWEMALLVANFLPADFVAPAFPNAIEAVLPFYPRLSLFSSARFGYGVGAGTLAVFGLWGFRNWVSRSIDRTDREGTRNPSRQMLSFALAAMGVFALLFIVTAAYDRRLLYPVLPFFSLLPALLFDAAYREAGLRMRGREGSISLPRFVGLGVIAAAAMVALVAQSPLFARDREWREAGRATDVLTEGLVEQWEQLPEESLIWLVNLPGGFDFDPRRRIQYTERSSTNALNAAGLQAWLDDRWPGRKLRVDSLGTYRYREPLEDFRHHARVNDGWLEFDEPRARADFDYAYASKRSFRLRDLTGGRFGLARVAGPRPPHEFLLVADGLAPVFVATSRLEVVR